MHYHIPAHLELQQAAAVLEVVRHHGAAVRHVVSVLLSEAAVGGLLYHRLGHLFNREVLLQHILQLLNSLHRNLLQYVLLKIIGPQSPAGRLNFLQVKVCPHLDSRLGPEWSAALLGEPPPHLHIQQVGLLVTGHTLK